ncbi:MAG: excisionase family DNA-binding protein [Acidimicrobiales bacterium]
MRMAMAAEIRPGSVEERELAVLERALTRRTSGRPAAQLLGGDGTPVDVPAELVDVLVAIVHELKAGNGVSIAALHAELTTVEAAELLNVSRPYLIKQLDAGALPFRMVGSHRRIRLVDVLAYRDRQDAGANKALDELTRQAEELDLYD